MRTQGCRDTIDWVLLNCHGLSPGAAAEVKLAGKFCKERAPYLELQSTKAINAIRVIKDPIIQGKVLELIKTAIETHIDPRTGEKLKQVAGITTPMVEWLIRWVETGEKPLYTKRSSRKIILDSEIIELLDLMRAGGIELCKSRERADLVPKIEAFVNDLVQCPKRDYRKEYDEYHSSPEQKKKRAELNRLRLARNGSQLKEVALS